MITMMLQFKYTPEAMKAILLSGDDRSEAIKKMVNGKEYYFSTEQSAEEYIRKNQTKPD